MSLVQSVCPNNHLHSSVFWPRAQVTQAEEAELRHRCFWDILPAVTKGETMDGLSDCCWSGILNKVSWPADAASPFNGNIPRVLLPRIPGEPGLTSFHANALSKYSLDPDLASTPSLHIHAKIQLWELEVWRYDVWFFAASFLTSVTCLRCCCFLLSFCLLLKPLFFCGKEERGWFCSLDHRRLWVCQWNCIKKKLGLKVFATNNEYSHLFYYSQSLEKVFWYFLLCSIIL